jgi:hypothetical protein
MVDEEDFLEMATTQVYVFFQAAAGHLYEMTLVSDSSTNSSLSWIEVRFHRRACY